jgi:hypothetical protein
VKVITHSVCVAKSRVSERDRRLLANCYRNVDDGLDDGIGGDGDKTRQEARGAMPKSG